MAMGSYNPSTNNNQNKNTVSLKSVYGMSNIEAKIERTALNFSFWNHLVKISIGVLEQRNDKYELNDEKGIAIFLTHTKARMLAYEIEEFLKDPEAYNNVGVNTNIGLISISNGKELGITGPCIIIRKIDENGNTIASISYELKQNYYYSVRNFSESNQSFDTFYHDNIELHQLKDLLEQYYLAMTNAFAYSVMDANRYNNYKTNAKLDSICENLGVDKNNKSSSSTFFNSNTSSNNSSNANKFISSSISELEDLN